MIDVYYGEGEILHGPNGVDLSNFNAIQRAVSNPEEKSFNALYKWLIRIFQIDETVEKLNVRGLVSRVTGTEYWELIPLNSNNG